MVGRDLLAAMPPATRQPEVSGMKRALLSAFKRKTPATKSPVKAPASEVAAAAHASSPSRRLFSFTPSKAGGPAPSPLRPKSAAPRPDDADAGGLIAAAPAAASTSAPAAAAAPGGDAISVLVRIRPRSAREAAVGGAICVHAGAAGQVRLGPPAEPHAFSFDRVAGEGAGQAEVFALAGAAVVDNCLAGYNGCVSAAASVIDHSFEAENNEITNQPTNQRTAHRSRLA